MNFSGCSFFSPEVSSLFFLVDVIVGGGREREREERAGIFPLFAPSFPVCLSSSSSFSVSFFSSFAEERIFLCVSDKDFDVSREIIPRKGALLEFGSNFFASF